MGRQPSPSFDRTSHTKLLCAYLIAPGSNLFCNHGFFPYSQQCPDFFVCPGQQFLVILSCKKERTITSTIHIHLMNAILVVFSFIRKFEQFSKNTTNLSQPENKTSIFILYLYFFFFVCVGGGGWSLSPFWYCCCLKENNSLYFCS